MIDASAAMNMVTFSAEQIQTAMEILAFLPTPARADPIAQGLALQAYAREVAIGDEPLAAAALHARIIALGKWTAAHDPARQSNAEAVIEATARYPLRETDDGIGFDHAGFQELVLFIEELPW